MLLLASRAEATPPSPCSFSPLWPKQRRHHLAPPRPSGKAAPSSPCSFPLLGPKQRRHSRASSRPSGRSNAAITVLILAPRAEAAPPSPCSSPPLGPSIHPMDVAPCRSKYPSGPWIKQGKASTAAQIPRSQVFPGGRGRYEQAGRLLRGR